MKKHSWPYYVFMRWTKLSKRDGWLYKYLEKRVPDYQLPDPLEFSNGTAVKTPEEWSKKRRQELLEIFNDQIYGRSPERPSATHYEVMEKKEDALNGIATRVQLAIYLLGKKKGPKVDFL